jgi:hypothetical protein
MIQYKPLTLKIKDVRTCAGNEYQFSGLYLRDQSISAGEIIPSKFVHWHLSIPSDLVQCVHKVLLDMRILCVSEQRGQEMLLNPSRGHNKLPT